MGYSFILKKDIYYIIGTFLVQYIIELETIYNIYNTCGSYVGFLPREKALIVKIK
jgi:hypothetical protein